MTSNCILVVEDEYLVGLNIQSTLSEAGFKVIGPAMNVKEALRLITENDLNAAVVDVNLSGEYSDGIASRLADLEIPFLLLTGYDRENLPVEFINALLIKKPFDRDELVETIQRLCSQKENQ